MTARFTCLPLSLLAALALLPLAAAPARGEPQAALASAAPAAPQPDEILVKEGFRTAEALRRAGDLTGALSVLRWTYERVRTPFLLWPMAELCLQLQEPLAGLQALSEYEAKLPPPERPEPGQPSARDLEAVRERLRAQVARLELVTDEPGALLVLDGRQLGRAPLREALEVDPGRHRVEARGRGQTAAEITVAPGARGRLTLPSMTAAKAPSGRPAVLSRLALLGVGLVAVAAGGALLGEDGACSAAGTCGRDLRTPGAAVLGVGAGVLGAAALLIGLEVHQRGGGKRGLRATLGAF